MPEYSVLSVFIPHQKTGQQYFSVQSESIRDELSINLRARAKELSWSNVESLMYSQIYS
jgi:hypothetical protein